MNIFELLKQYRDVAEFLSDNTNVALIDSLTNRLEKKTYLLPFIGQFSAGKSKLINRILGKDVLPTKSSETTAFLTYVIYSEQEHAVLEYVDGTTRQIDIAEIKELDHKNTVNEKPIAELRYYTPLELLKSGLVIVDTPGVNTLIQSHVKMTEELLQNSQYIVYVTATSFTDSDKKMIEQIDRLGIEMICVRTHIDEVREDEEDVYATIRAEENSLKGILGKDEVMFFSMCNDESSPKFSHWEWQYNNFIEYISKGIASNIEGVYLSSTVNRLVALKDDFEKSLKSRLDLIESNSKKSDAELEEILTQLIHQKASIDNRISYQQNDIKKSADNIKSTIENKLISNKNSLINSFDDIINNFNNTDDLLAKVKVAFRDNLSKSLDQLNDQASSSIINWTEGQMGDIQKEVEGINDLLTPLDITFDKEFDFDDISTYEDQADANITDFAEKYSQIKELNSRSEEELAQYGVDKAKINELLEQYEKIIAQGKENVREAIAAYKPQYVQQGGQLGPMMKKIGQVADIAVLFVPAAGWEKAGAMLGKNAAKLAKSGGALAKAGSEILSDLSMAAKAMAKSDTIIDITKIIGKAKGEGPMSPIQQVLSDKKETASFFDYLSLSYWFEKAGDMIDPATFVEDQQYRQQYDLIVKQMQEEVNDKVRQRVALAKKLGEINNAEEATRREIQEREIEERKMQEDLKRERQRIEEQRRQAIRTRIVEDAKNQFKQSISNYLELLISRVREKVDSIAAALGNSMSSFINKQLEDVTQQLQEIKDKRADASYSFTQETECIKTHLENLKIPNE